MHSENIETGLEPLEIPLSGVYEIRGNHILEFQRGEHICRIGIGHGIRERKCAAQGHGLLQAVAMVEKEFPVKFGQHIGGLVTYQGQYLEIVIVGDGGKTL